MAAQEPLAERLAAQAALLDRAFVGKGEARPLHPAEFDLDAHQPDERHPGDRRTRERRAWPRSGADRRVPRHLVERRPQRRRRPPPRLILTNSPELDPRAFRLVSSGLLAVLVAVVLAVEFIA